MAYQEKQRFCKACNKNVLARRRSPNHILHLILTLITAGIWIIVWLGVSIQFGGWRCTQCGAKV